MWNDRAVAGDDAGGVLAAVLQQQQPVVEQLVDRRVRDDADDSAHERQAFPFAPARPGDVRPVAGIIEPLGPRPAAATASAPARPPPAAGARAEFCHQSCLGRVVTPATSANADHQRRRRARRRTPRPGTGRRSPGRPRGRRSRSGQRDERADDQHGDEDQREREHVRATGAMSSPANSARQRSGVTRSPRRSRRPTRERDHFADDAAHEREQHRQRDDGDDGEIESVHRRRRRRGMRDAPRRRVTSPARRCRCSPRPSASSRAASASGRDA